MPRRVPLPPEPLFNSTLVRLEEEAQLTTLRLAVNRFNSTLVRLEGGQPPANRTSVELKRLTARRNVVNCASSSNRTSVELKSGSGGKGTRLGIPPQLGASWL